MEKQPDLQVPQGAEKTPGSRRSTETLNRIIGELAERAQGVSAAELAQTCEMSRTWAFSRLHQRLKAGLLVMRNGAENGKPITRFWREQEVADRHQFPATLRDERWAAILANLAEGGSKTPELSRVIGLDVTPLAVECWKMFHRGLIFRAEDVDERGHQVYRYFRTQAEADEWSAVPGNRVQEKRALLLIEQAKARREKAAAHREAIRAAKPPKAPKPKMPAKAPNERPATTGLRAPKAPKQVRAHEPVQPKVKAVKLPKAKPRKAGAEVAVPPALQAGQPIITEQTKITRVATPLGRYEVEGSRVIGGFGTLPIGHYDRPASNWAQALAEAA